MLCSMDGGQWTPASRNQYNLHDAVSRCTTQVSIIHVCFFFVWSNNVVDVFCFWLEALIVDFVQVYPMSWTAIYVALDNVGMWNLRSEFWARQYLGQQLYLRVFTTSTSIRDEFPVPKNAILCGRASGRHTRPLWRVDASRRSILALEYEE